jgi:transposase-like protein
MGRKYVKYTQEFREAALRRFQTAGSVSALCRELGISRQLLYQWRASAERDRQWQQHRRSVTLSQENARLKKLLLEKTLEADFFRGAFERIEDLRRSASGSGETASSPRSGR